MAEIRIGGQAVIEGVVMRGEKKIATAVRKPNGTIEVKVEEKLPWSKSHPLLGLPIIRGVVTLAETLTLGVQALNYSANVSLEKENEKIDGWEFTLTVLLSIIITIALFMALPAFFFTYLSKFVANTILLNLIEGSIRISIFFIFVLIISKMPDMKRVFEYHGAEHKVVHEYEELSKKGVKDIKENITVEGAKKYPTGHVSCGTSFLLLVLIVSIFVFSFLGRPSFINRVLLKLLVLPLVAGISYEVIRLARKADAPKILKIIVTPGVWLQKITTKEPSPDQLEVAIRAIKEVI